MLTVEAYSRGRWQFVESIENPLIAYRMARDLRKQGDPARVVTESWDAENTRPSGRCHGGDRDCVPAVAKGRGGLRRDRLHLTGLAIMAQAERKTAGRIATHPGR